MAQDYTQYLAAHVVNEQQFVTYRQLSRALKIHVNLAKQSLYDFHRKQNARKVGAIHATFLITGTRQAHVVPAVNAALDEDGDAEMQSSQVYPSSSAAKPDDNQVDTPGLVRTLMLVREEQLDQAKAGFETITSVHIYSLEPHALNDMHVLGECNRRVAIASASEDPLTDCKKYGTIQNPNARKKTRRAPGTAPLTKSTSGTSGDKPQAASREGNEEANVDLKPVLSAAKPSKDSVPKSAAKKPATVKRQSSDIFKSFAKGAVSSQPKKSSTPSLATAPPKEAQDLSTNTFSDDEPESEPDQEQNREVNSTLASSKQDRKATLEAMMEQSDQDEPMEDAASAMIDEDEEKPGDDTESDKLQGQREVPQEAMSTSNGRRRGRRRVMKKKTVKDEEGYLVTKEEPVWESFSEDEPQPATKKLKPMVSAQHNEGSGKGKKSGGAKQGKGNIMSFFGKK